MYTLLGFAFASVSFLDGIHWCNAQNCHMFVSMLSMDNQARHAGGKGPTKAERRRARRSLTAESRRRKPRRKMSCSEMRHTACRTSHITHVTYHTRHISHTSHITHVGGLWCMPPVPVHVVCCVFHASGTANVTPGTVQNRCSPPKQAVTLRAARVGFVLTSSKVKRSTTPL